MSLFAVSQSKDVIVQFKAGIMHFNPETRMVTPDRRKGLIIVKKEDELTHFQWKDRKSGEIETDLIVFPDDAIFRKVEESNGRVYLLDFKTSDQKLFFWMQEPDAEKDAELAKKVNEGINGTSSSDSLTLSNLLKSQTSLEEDSKKTEDESTKKEQTTTTSPQQQQQQQTKSAADILREQFYRIIDNLESSTPSFSLSDIVNTQNIIETGILNNEEVVKELQKHLPENEENSALDTLRSPQFKQAVSAFNDAIKSGYLSELLVTFGLEMPSQQENAPNIEKFLRALQEKVDKEKGKK